MALYSRLARGLRRRLRRGSPLPQLRMRLQIAAPPRPPPLPLDCEVRAFVAGDEERWVALLNGDGDGGGELGAWTRQRLQIDALAYLVPGTQWFVWCDALLAAGAGVYERSPAGWEVGWVATQPELRGRGLGRSAVTAAVTSALALPARPVWLFTDDHRDAAIRLYLRLGFAPDSHHPSHPRRWHRVLERLGPEFCAHAIGDIAPG